MGKSKKRKISQATLIDVQEENHDSLNMVIVMENVRRDKILYIF